MASQKTAWEIGRAYYDQTDLYTRNGSVEASGYGRGPSFHPTEGSYAYHRDPQFGHNAVREYDASLYEREAWPWLNYADDDPYFSRLRHGAWKTPRPFFAALKERLLHLFGWGEAWGRADKRIHEDVARAFDFRADLDSSDITVKVRNGRVTLEGTVEDQRSKRLAEETASGIRGVLAVDNRLEIRDEDPRGTNPLFVLPFAGS